MSETVQTKKDQTAGVITTAAFFTIFIYSFVVSLPGILINEVVEAFSLSGAEEGLMGTLTSFGFMISLFFVILVQGRAQKTTILMAMLVLQALMLFVCGFSPTFFILCTGSVLVGFSGGFLDSGSNSVIVDVRKGESARFLGYLHGLFGVGSLLSPLVFIWVLRRTDWRGVHYALALASSLVMLIIFLMTRGVVKNKSQVSVREHLFTKADLLAYLRIRRNVALILAGLFAMFAIACVMVWIVRYMTLRFDAGEIGMLSISVFWICATANRFFLTPIIKRAPMKFFALGAFLSGVFILTGLISGSPVVFCIMTGAFGLCSGHFIPVLVSECAKGYEGRTTFTTSLLMFSMSTGRIAAPVMMAFISTQISLTASMILPITTVIAASFFGWYAVKTK